jgi:hypothetical protein
VRFCLDGTGGVTWNMGVCMVCNPFTYRPFLGKTSKKKNGGNAHNNQDDIHAIA